MTRIRTTAPMLKWADVTALNRPVMTSDDLFRPWRGPTDVVFPLARGSWALRALVEASRRGRDALPIVWVPDFFCNQANALLRLFARLIFYPVTERLEPDWTRCSDLARVTPPDVFVLVHYFGYPAPTGPARRFCDEHGALFVEDAAHALMPSPQIGQSGDAVIWSLYKHLASPDGGLLVVCDQSRLPADKVRAATSSWSGGPPSALSWVCKRALQLLLPTQMLRGPMALPPFDIDPDTSDMPDEPSLSKTAHRLLATQSTSLTSIASKRRANDRALRSMIGSRDDFVPLLPLSDENWVPYRSVWRAKDSTIAREYYDCIRASGNVVETWPDLAPEVRQNHEGHTHAITLRNSILAIPIHADRSPGEIADAYSAAFV